MTKNRLNELLLERGMTRYELAKKSGLTLTYVYNLAAADEIPFKTQWGTLKKIRDTLGLTSVDELEEPESSV